MDVFEKKLSLFIETHNNKLGNLELSFDKGYGKASYVNIHNPYEDDIIITLLTKDDYDNFFIEFPKMLSAIKNLCQLYNTFTDIIFGITISNNFIIDMAYKNKSYDIKLIPMTFDYNEFLIKGTRYEPNIYDFELHANKNCIAETLTDFITKNFSNN